MQCVASGLKTGHSFREAELAELQLSGAAVETLVSALLSTGTLVRLSITDCGLGDEGVASIIAAVRAKITLDMVNTVAILELRSNRISNHGASAIAEALAGNTSLRTLDLQRNDVKDQGGIALAAALQVNRSLEVLNVRFNEISDAGATALGRALQANPVVSELHLGGNLVGPEGAVHLASALETNATLKTLNLRSNAILDVGAVAMVCGAFPTGDHANTHRVCGAH